nr:immunoglobulin light chain junction region [Macaca mulatta]
DYYCHSTDSTIYHRVF